jgi:anthranilate phosphoribosyltransferase
MPDHKATSSSTQPVGPSEFARAARPGDLTPAILRLLAGKTLSAEETAAAFEAMMSGESHHGEIGALLALLATRTPTSAEILGAARIMRKHVSPVELPEGCDAANVLDTAGTGGGPKTFNVSTAAAIIAAPALPNVRVAKHGNRSRTGRGSAEVLTKLGVNVDADHATQTRCLEQAGVCFCFAIHHHPATRHVMPVRQALGFPTIFNLLGPLTNPAGARRQVMGVYEQRFMRPIAEALRDLGAIRAMVVHSEDGLDEFSISAATHVLHVRDGKIVEESISPEDVGLNRAPREQVMARDLDHAAQMIRDILDGKEQGPPRDMAILNAAAAIVVASDDIAFRRAIEMARETIDQGAARKTLEKLCAASKT